MTVVLVHGGLWEDMDAARFWLRPGVVDGLRAAGLDVLAPDRVPRAAGWDVEVALLAALLDGPSPGRPNGSGSGAPPGPVTVVGGSNGCSVAARLAVDRPELVDRLVLAWPATAGDPRVDALAEAPAALLAGETLRGLRDADLAGLRMPVSVLPSVPDNPFHQRRTVDALLRVIPGATELPGTPEPPRPDFAAHRDHLVATLVTAAR